MKYKIFQKIYKIFQICDKLVMIFLVADQIKLSAKIKQKTNQSVLQLKGYNINS